MAVFRRRMIVWRDGGAWLGFAQSLRHCSPNRWPLRIALRLATTTPPSLLRSILTRSPSVMFKAAWRCTGHVVGSSESKPSAQGDRWDSPSTAASEKNPLSAPTHAPQQDKDKLKSRYSHSRRSAGRRRLTSRLRGCFRGVRRRQPLPEWPLRSAGDAEVRPHPAVSVLALGALFNARCQRAT